MILSTKQRYLRVLVVDDHELTRLSLKVLFDRHKNIELVGLATNGKEAIDLVEKYHPDVIVMDWHMPVMNGLTASSHIKNFAPQTQIIIFSSKEIISEKAPIDYFCKKDISTEKLIELVKQLGSRSLINSDQ